VTTPRSERWGAAWSCALSRGPLSKAQKAFNRLVATVEKLRARVEQHTRRLDEALAFHAEQVRPRLERVTALRREVVRALRPFLSDRRLKARDQEVLRTILTEQLKEILDGADAVDDELRALFEELHIGDLAQVEEDALQEARASIEAQFADVGLDVDLSGFHPGMSEEDVAVKVAEMEDQIRRQTEEARGRGRPGQRRTKRELREEARIRQVEELRKGTIGAIYRRLAKVLHPDLEQDADLRRRKSTLMQELTAAYASSDLHTLLRLELEWIHHEESDVARLTDEKLDAYRQLLKEQVAQLEMALFELPQHPRYQPLVGLEGPFGVVVQFDGPAKVLGLEFVIASLGDSVARLQAGNAWPEVCEIIRARRMADRVRS
jgi:hypothetical protein